MTEILESKRLVMRITISFIACWVAICLLATTANAQMIARPLSEEDAARYTRIFATQKSANWAAADRDIAALQDRVLMGYVLRQRYMHRTGYRSTYRELANWLELYADHPYSAKVYNLARARRPKGATPRRDVKRKWRVDSPQKLHPELAADYYRNGREDHIRWIEGRVRWYNADDRPTQALNFVNAKRKDLTEAQYDRITSWIAASYYYNGVYNKARSLARQSAKRNGDKAVLAYWIAGLDAFRIGEHSAATDYFSAMAAVPWQDDTLRAGAGFWAARSALIAGREDLIVTNLEIAAQFPYTFYGQLALGQLGQKASYNWIRPDFTTDQWARLESASPRMKRAAALTQAGQDEYAHTEIRWAVGELPISYDTDMLALAFDLGLPAAQIDIAITGGAMAGRAPHLEAGLFPTPDWQPNGGFTLDKAIIFGLIRQESKFKSDAKSRVGAAGLMQLMPRTASAMAKGVVAYDNSRLYTDKAYNMQLGQSYVNRLLTRHTNGDLFEMALSYNWGPGNVRRFKAKSGIADQLLMLESIPNPEARDFVEHVLRNMWVYRAKFGEPAPSRDAAAAGGKAIYQSVTAFRP